MSTSANSLNEFAYGFEFQKGAIFGFGEKKDNDTGTVLKICAVGEEKLNSSTKCKYIK